MSSNHPSAYRYIKLGIFKDLHKSKRHPFLELQDHTNKLCKNTTEQGDILEILGEGLILNHPRFGARKYWHVSKVPHSIRKAST
jgi:hypothetical protein